MHSYLLHKLQKILEKTSKLLVLNRPVRVLKTLSTNVSWWDGIVNGYKNKYVQDAHARTYTKGTKFVECDLKAFIQDPFFAYPVVKGEHSLNVFLGKLG